jgi:hypothetical protein
MVFKASNKSIFINVLIVILLFLLIILVKGQEIKKGFLIAIAITIIYLIQLFLNKTPVLIKIEPPNLIIRFSRFLLYHTVVNEKISELTQSFKTEVGPKGIKRKVYRIYNGTQSVVRIVPNYNGWNTHKIKSLSHELQELGVNLLD